MKENLVNFGSQLMEACKWSWNKLLSVDKLSNVVICGMGGSAISGDFLAGYLRDEIKVPILVNRGYEIPEFVDNNSLVFVSSYSGNTEETISAYKYAISRTPNVLCVTSGGKLLDMSPIYLFKIPIGYQPRCALGWLFVPMLTALHNLGIIGDKRMELEETSSLLLNTGKEFGLHKSIPYTIAEKLDGRFPIIYSDLRFECVARRWVNQLNENSKHFAHYNIFSELNHNEIVGFGEPKLPVVLIILKDNSYNPRINLRIELTKRMLSSYDIYEIESCGSSLLAHFFYLIYFGDWVSYWLANIKGIDPTPIERIDWLKKELAK